MALSFASAQAQQTQPASSASPVKLSGSVSATTESYSTSGIAPRYPGNVSRLILQANVQLYEQINLPFELYLSTQQLTLQQPFNQFGVSPVLFGWLKLHAGYYTAQLSELTFGDARMLGGGIEASPGNFRFAVLYGQMRTALSPDSASGFFGQYARTALAAKIGYGNLSSTYLDLNVVKAFDDSASVAPSASTAPPSENVATSLAFGFPVVSDRIKVAGEIGVSLFSGDVRVQEATEYVSVPKFLFTPRYSSQVDAAAVLSVLTRPTDDLTVALNGRWIGPGYVTLGYVQLPSDVLETTVAPSVRLLNGALSLRGSLGFRFNDLRGNRLSPTTRTIGSLYSSWQATQAFGLDAQYTNYGIRTAPRLDTLRIENVSQSLTLSPRFLFPLFGAQHTLLLSYSLQDVNDQSILGGKVNRNVTQTALASWSQAFGFPLSLTTTALYNNADVAGARLQITSLSETLGYNFLEGKLNTSLTLGVNWVNNALPGISSNPADSPTDSQITAVFSAGYGFGVYGTVSLNLSNNAYSATSTVPTFQEFHGVLQYSLSLQ